MSLAIDASTPIRWTGTPADDVNITSPSFTAPSGAILVLTVEADSTTANQAGADLTITVGDSGGLTWTQRVEADKGTVAGWDGVGEGGGAYIFTATTVSATARTVTVQRSNGNGGTNRISCKLYAVTGQNTTDPIGASGTGSTTTNDSALAVLTTEQANSLVFLCLTDWSQSGSPSSSDGTEDSADYSGAISVMSAYEAQGAAGAVTMNANHGGTGNVVTIWAALEIIEEPAGGGGGGPVGHLLMLGVG